MLPDQHNIEEVDPIASEIIIPGLPFLSKNLAVGRGARPSQTGRMERDLALYDRKSQDFYEKIVEEANKFTFFLNFELNKFKRLACFSFFIR